MPTVRAVAPLVEEEPTEPRARVEANLRRNWMVSPMGANTKPTNSTGHPALAVPCGKVGGLPISLQLLGRFMDDALPLRVAYAFQQQVDWDAVTGVER
jgi:amidase